MANGSPAKALNFARSGRWFAALLAAAAIAFWPPYLSILPFGADRYVNFHVATVSLWMLYLIVQPALIRAGRRAWHRRLGRTSYLLVPLLLLASLLLAHHRVAMRSAAEAPAVYFPASAMVLFALCYALAIRNRRDVFIHARCMVATALPLIDPIVQRLIGFYSPVWPSDYWFPAPGYLITDLVLAALIVAELGQTRGRRVFPTLLVLFFAAHFGWFTVAQSHAWADAAMAFRSLPLP